MTVTSQVSRAVFTGNGSTTVFGFNFRVLSQADLQVSLVTSGVSVVQTISTHYSVVLTDTSGTVTFVTAPASGVQVVVERLMDYTQPTDYSNQGSFYPSTHERSFDRATMLVQQLQDVVGRSPAVPAWVEGFTAELPTPVANRFLVVNSTADGFTLSDQSPVADPTLRGDLAANGGAALVGFLNGVSLQNRVRERAHLYDYGSSSDWTSAMLAAANAGIDIQLPAGNITVEQEIPCKNGTRFHGAGYWGGAAGAPDPTRDTIVKAGVAMDCVFRYASEAVGTEPTDAATRSMRAVGCTNLVVDANGLADFGIYAVRANLLSHFERLVCIGAKEYGFWGGLMWTCVLKDIMCRGNEKNGFGLGKNLYSWAGTTNCNNNVLMNITGQFNGTAETFNEGVLEDEGIGVELYLHRGNTCMNINAEFNDGAGIYVQSTSVPNTFVGGYTENNGQSATATKEWDLWIEGEAAGASANLTFQGMIVIDDVKITGTEPAEAGAYSPLEFRDCFIDGDIDASWNNFKLIDTRHNGAFPNQKPIGRLFSAKVGDTLYKDTRVQGVAEAWGKIDGTGTPSISKGLNITSITDNGTGDYWVNFTRNMPSTEYCVVCSGNNLIVGVQAQEVSRVRINVRDNAGTLTDGVFNLMVFSDD